MYASTDTRTIVDRETKGQGVTGSAWLAALRPAEFRGADI